MVRAVTRADGSAGSRCAVPEHWSPLLLPQLPRTPLLRTPLRRLTPSSVHARQSIAACIAPVHCRFLSGTPRIVLADLNTNALHKAARRIRRYRPTSCQLNVLAHEPFLAFYNRTGVINNAGDTLADLEACLRSRLSQVEIRVVGSVALFSGSVGSRQGL